MIGKTKRCLQRMVTYAALASLVTIPGSGAALGAGDIVERVSVANDGTQGNRESFAMALSADGRFVAFTSRASNLVTGDTNGIGDVFVHDVQAGTTELVSLATSGTQANNQSFAMALSADGRFVTFYSDATNLVMGDTNNESDVFVRDRQTGTTERVSVANDGAQGNGESLGWALSANGRFVAFTSRGSNLVAGDTNGAIDVFVRDRQAGTTERVSLTSDGAQANDGSFSTALSADGRYVAFESLASNLVAGDPSGTWDIFVRDRQTNTTERISVASDGAQANGESRLPSLSADGRFVAFVSAASNLVAADTNRAYDVFVRDRQTHTTERVSLPNDGAQATRESWSPALSDNGRFVAFLSRANNLVAGDTNGAQDVFLRDRQAGTTERVSQADNGIQGNGDSWDPALSADGRFLAFESVASNLVAGDTNGASDVFFARRTVTLTVRKAGTGGGTVTSTPDGIDCGADCTERYVPDGTRVELTATADAGSRFAEWSGACTGTAATCVVTMDVGKTVRATFKPTADLALTISDSPDPVAVGGILTYTIRVTNNGPNPASVVTVSDALTDLTFESAVASQGTCATSTTTPVKVTCTPGTLAVGGTATVTLRARPTTVMTALRNAATATATVTSDPSPIDARASTTTRVVGEVPKIVFVSTRDGNNELYTMSPDGSAPIRLTTSPANDLYPSWSPDRSKIAFASDRDGSYEIYVMNADGSGQTRLTTSPAEDTRPAWSPDGSTLAFVSNRDGNFEIYVMPSVGGTAQRLTTSPALDHEPIWSPDGSKLAFTSNRDGNFEIYAMRADGTGVTRLTNVPPSDREPAWSPIGGRLAFTSLRDGNREIYVMYADGSGQTRLTTAPADDRQAAWSPDGAKLVFASVRDGNEEIYVMNADGSGQTRLTTLTTSDSQPDW